jgi:hypothetical protein
MNVHQPVFSMKYINYYAHFNLGLHFLQPQYLQNC